ncbi:MAG: peptidylprolyl isomerase [Candidatus Roizmanbacteria bacterium]|nr:peptidylprolyl isomerase [Candidatus Roizmanbacteria bacterium]MCR4313202.1 peptidylprolyl isomerase [Candidatus Roizmanbacteria bacterium]
MNIKYSLIIIVIVIIVGLVGFSVVKNFQSQTGGTESQNNMKGQKLEINKNKKYSAVLHTEKGDITIELTAKKTPITVNNFVTLAKKGFYDNTIFHRVIKGFMIQGGDPKGDGTGDPGYKFDDEPFDGEYTRGTVAMANAGPDTNGSQFFIMHADNPLPKDYVIFGKIKSGMDVVDTIAGSPVQANFSGEVSTPITPIKILTIDIK